MGEWKPGAFGGGMRRQVYEMCHMIVDADPFQVERVYILASTRDGIRYETPSGLVLETTDPFDDWSEPTDIGPHLTDRDILRAT